MPSKIADVATGFILLGAIYLATKPGSQGANFVRAVGGAFQGILATATGQQQRRR